MDHYLAHISHTVIEEYERLPETLRIEMKGYVDNKESESILKLAGTSTVIANYVMSNPYIPVDTAALMMAGENKRTVGNLCDCYVVRKLLEIKM